MPRKILVTSALPYANGSIHLGHLVEYIQTDIWVRFQKMQPDTQVHYVCADDTHGTPVMLRADQEGITPEQLIARVYEEHTRDFAGFHIAFDNYYTTNSPENQAFCEDIYARLQAEDLIARRPVEQFYDPVKQMFLPDRFIRGECPNCHSKDQYGDSCEVCGTTYSPTDLINPYSVVSGAAPVRRASEHYFFKLSDARCRSFLEQWTQGKLSDSLRSSPKQRTRCRNGSRPGCRTGTFPAIPPTSASRSPARTAAKFFYVWLDAPVGYFGSFRNYATAAEGPGRRGGRRRLSAPRPRHRDGPLHRQGHPLFPCPVLAGNAAVRRLSHADQGFRPRLSDRGRRRCPSRAGLSSPREAI